MLYVLVGGPFTIMDTPHVVEVWGAPVEIPEDLARGAMKDGALILPKDQFDKLDFSAQELKYSNIRAQANAPPEFHEKMAAAQKAAREYSAGLQSAANEEKA